MAVRKTPPGSLTGYQLAEEVALGFASAPSVAIRVFPAATIIDFLMSDIGKHCVSADHERYQKQAGEKKDPPV